MNSLKKRNKPYLSFAIFPDANAKVYLPNSFSAVFRKVSSSGRQWDSFVKRRGEFRSYVFEIHVFISCEFFV